jgi:hypothetical protein
MPQRVQRPLRSNYARHAPLRITAPPRRTAPRRRRPPDHCTATTKALTHSSTNPDTGQRHIPRVLHRSRQDGSPLLPAGNGQVRPRVARRRSTGDSPGHLTSCKPAFPPVPVPVAGRTCGRGQICSSGQIPTGAQISPSAPIRDTVTVSPRPRRTADPVHLGRGAPAPVRHGMGRSGRVCASASSAAVQLSQ